jgi:hypothetical protein
MRCSNFWSFAFKFALRSFTLSSCVLIIHFNLSGQKLTLSKDSFQIGEIIVLTIQAKPQTGDNQSINIDFSKIKNLLYPKDTSMFEQYADVLIDSISDPNAQLVGNSILIKSVNRDTKITFSIFSIGVFVIKHGSDSLVLKVVPPKGLNVQNAAEIKDIKPIIEDNSFDYMTLIYWLFGILLLMAVAYWLYKKYKEKKNRESFKNSIIETADSPYDEAMHSLQILIDTKQYESEEVKDFQTRLTDIIRQYTSRVYYINSFEMTSDEIVNALNTTHGLTEDTSILTDLFSLSDQVKFAKARPGHELCREAIDKAIYFVKNTNQ